MDYRNISGVPIPLSRVVFGCAIAPMIAGENCDTLLDAVFESGINTFDTAENYGKSEISLGGWINRRGNRDKVVIIDKGCHPYGRDRVTPEDMRLDIEQSFRRLGTDVIDIYFLHRDDYKINVGTMVEILNEYFSAGKIRAFGGSNWTTERIEAANEYAAAHNLRPFTVSSPNFGLAEQISDPFGGGAGCVSISGSSHASDRRWYEARNMPVFAYSSIGRGFFSGKLKSGCPEKAADILDEFAYRGYFCPENIARLARVEALAARKNSTVSQIALAWVLEQKMNVFPIVSAKTPERITETLGALDVSLNGEELVWLDKG